MIAKLLPSAAVVALLALLPSAGMAAQLDSVAADHIAGRETNSGASFAADQAGDTVTVTVRLGTGKSFIGRIDYAKRTVAIRTERKDPAVPAAMLRDESAALDSLLANLDVVPSRTGDALSSFVNLLSSAPVGRALEVDTAGRRDPDEPADYRSLCRSTGELHRAKFDRNGREHIEQVQVGPCYNKENGCMGRCGINCESTDLEGIGNPRVVQRFTQACLNHDLCSEKTGKWLGQCADEFEAAIDDFFFAPDCASMTGYWTDANGWEWRVKQTAGFDLQGRVRVPECGVYSLSGGHHDGKLYRLKAFAKDPRPGCCERFAQEGRLQTCDAATYEIVSNCSVGEEGTFTRQTRRLEDQADAE